MLPKRFRLTKPEFQTVRDHGQLYSARLMAVLILRLSDYPTSDIRHPKAGLIVSLRLSPKAVVRTRLKRRLRAALQRVLPEIPANIRLVVLPNRRSLDATVDELGKEIRVIVQKIPDLGSRISDLGKSETPTPTIRPSEIRHPTSGSKTLSKVLK